MRYKAAREAADGVYMTLITLTTMLPSLLMHSSTPLSFVDRTTPLAKDKGNPPEASPRMVFLFERMVRWVYCWLCSSSSLFLNLADSDAFLLLLLHDIP